MWSSSAPVADCPASFSQRPGSIAPKYGPHTPGICRGSGDTAMWQVEVPAIIARRAVEVLRRERAEQADAARMRVDQADADDAALA